MAHGFVDMCLHKKRKAKVVEKGGGSHSTWPASHKFGPASHHLVSYHLGRVSGAPPWPHKYHPPVEIRTQTPLLRNSTCKALILSVVATCSLVGRVARTPRCSSITEALSESFGVQQGFLALVSSSAEVLSESYVFWQRVSARVPWMK
jgi:hypothetical protein